METETDLDSLSSVELHDLAVRRALHRADVGFFWELLRAIPAAETLEGDVREAGEDLTKVSSLLSDALTLQRGQPRGRAAPAVPRLPAQAPAEAIAGEARARRSPAG